MSTSKHIDKICYVVLAITLILSLLFVNAERFGVQKMETVFGYETTLFDATTVHTIDIVMDDWDDFLENCKSEEYYNCTLVIDNEAFKNVGIRAKGNTSLTQVESYGNDRYSFKVEFDYYESGNTYHGLDKLCLNNLIQDNTCMKDFLTFQMMNEMGVASSLCSYVYITVNGEDWGLYLAVEGVEESFLSRNFGSDYGELYKPDSSSMGGDRGGGEQPTGAEMPQMGEQPDGAEMPQMGEKPDGAEMPQPGEKADGMEMPQQGEKPDGMEMPQMGEQPDGAEMPQQGEKPDGMEMPQMGEQPDGAEMPQMGEKPDGMEMPQQGEKPDGMEMPQMGSDDVLLKYIDDDADSYANIFDNAKTDVSDADKTRLIESLKRLSEQEDLEQTVDVDAVIRYFVVHNFVLNFDSYTGSMIHNYYLYEDDGVLQMIPWDYNLAFGGFESEQDATELVNDPIDSPVSGGSVEDRPMLAWIFAEEEYTQLYHQYFDTFLSEYFESGYFEEMIDRVEAMIAPYVEKDPTKFCTYEEFENGVSVLKDFCLLRAESIRAQLNGEIGTTEETQEKDTWIDAGDLQIRDMGTMHND